MTLSSEQRTLVVLADGAQAAFAAAAIAELWRTGRRWRAVFGAGLGAQLAALAAIGEAEEGERRWRRQAEQGCPLLVSRLAAVRERGGLQGLLLLPDPASLGGWLDPVPLEEHLLPEASIGARLRASGGRCAVAIEDLSEGTRQWIDLTLLEPEGAAAALLAAACFAGGWPPITTPGSSGERQRAGGVAAALGLELPDGPVDLVCGFPVPAAFRPALAPALLETVQRRDEGAAASAVAAWSRARADVYVCAPDERLLRAAAGREDAEIGVEWPLPFERNPDLVTLALEVGRRAAAECGNGPGR